MSASPILPGLRRYTRMIATHDVALRIHDWRERAVEVLAVACLNDAGAAQFNGAIEAGEMHDVDAVLERVGQGQIDPGEDCRSLRFRGENDDRWLISARHSPSQTLACPPRGVSICIHAIIGSPTPLFGSVFEKHILVKNRKEGDFLAGSYVLFTDSGRMGLTEFVLH
ncbi:hypothetical protein L210DRAFT_933999 [Boletus edulis BED1]|uniref:Uncharacterized protein n=1 Tax=Boletus edulis BED1 TaxID=1328754 RepID=A0AAD4BZD5_BOLED|nr:hypothetical protein L210DRAFT_933999 [Boletus edulis BED1]